MALKDIFGGEEKETAPKKGGFPPAKKGFAAIFEGEKEEGEGKVSLEKAKFRDEKQRCSLCEYYQEEENNCSKVEGVSFDTSDPDLSSCDFFETGGESPETEDKEKEKGKEIPEDKQGFGAGWKKENFG